MLDRRLSARWVRIVSPPPRELAASIADYVARPWDVRNNPIDSNGDTLTSLPLHRTYARILEEQPIVCLIPLPGALGVADLVFRIIALNKILHDASRLEEPYGLAIGKSVGKRGNAAIRVDSEELVGGET